MPPIADSDSDDFTGIDVEEDADKIERPERRARYIHPDSLNFMVAPLNRERGELIGDPNDPEKNLGWDFVIVPTSKWSDSPIMRTAATIAGRAFKRSGYPTPTFSDDTVLIQEYHGQDRIALVFAQWGQRHFRREKSWCYVPVVIRLTPPLRAHLVLTNRWPSAPAIVNRTKH